MCHFTSPPALYGVILTCSGDTSNYTSVNFTVDTSGTYVFALETPSPYFDAMGYIFETASGSTPGTCSIE